MKLIKLNTDHYIIVDDSKINNGDVHFDFDKNEIDIWEGNLHSNRFKCKKITHSTQPLEQYYGATDGTIPFVYHKINPLSLSEVKELIGEVNVEKKEIILTDSQKELLKMGSVFYKDSSVIYYLPYIIINENNKWYIQLEDNKEKKYTEEDIDKAYWAGMQFIGEDKGSFGEFIQSLQPKTEWEVEFVDGKLKLK